MIQQDYKKPAIRLVNIKTQMVCTSNPRTLRVRGAVGSQDGDGGVAWKNTIDAD